MPDLKKYQTDISEIIPKELQPILVAEHYFRKKTLEYLSKNFSIPIMDLRFFFYTEDALSLYKELKEKLTEYPEPNSVQEYKEYIIEKSKELLENSSPFEFATLVRDVTPQVISLDIAEKKSSQQMHSNTSDSVDADYTVVEGHDSYSPFIELEFVKAKVLTPEDLEKIPPAKEITQGEETEN